MDATTKTRMNQLLQHKNLHFLILSISYLITSGCADAVEGVLRDYCEHDVFRATCPHGNVILINEARYGRMQLGTCLKIDYGSLNCSSDVQGEMDRGCSGRHTCAIKVSDLVTKRNPCPDELRSYLQASYTCFQVITPTEQCCQLGETHINVGNDHGYIASSVTRSTGCGNIDCPWLLNVPKGQQIRMYLYEFDISSRPTDERPLYAVVKENSLGKTRNIYAGNERYRQVHTTSSNSLELSIVDFKGDEDYPDYFILEYQAFGCTDPVPPVRGFMTRENDRASIQCQSSEDEIWEIRCEDGEWIGNVGNCSFGPPIEAGVGDFYQYSELDHITPEIVMACIIALALIITVTIVTVGVVCMKRHLHQEDDIAVSYAVQPSRQHQWHECSIKMGEEGKPLTQTRRESDIPWYLTRPLPKPGVEPAIAYFTDNGYENPHERLRDCQENDMEYYELDPEAVTLPHRSNHKWPDQHRNEHTIPRNIDRKARSTTSNAFRNINNDGYTTS